MIRLLISCIVFLALSAQSKAEKPDEVAPDIKSFTKQVFSIFKLTEIKPVPSEDKKTDKPAFTVYAITPETIQEMQRLMASGTSIIIDSEGKMTIWSNPQEISPQPIVVNAMPPVYVQPVPVIAPQPSVMVQPLRETTENQPKKK